MDTAKIRNDRLGTLVIKLCEDLANASSWEAFVTEFRGPSYLSSELDNIDHPAATLLRQWRDHGVPAETSSPPWTMEQKDRCVERGCHHSANEHSDFVRDELANFIENKFWMVLPYEMVKHFIELLLSPAAIKEERDRKPRLLCDHTWYWGWPSVNESTLPHAPPEAMQFGWALHRILTIIRHANPKFGPVRAAKADIKDGFYRLFLRALDCLRLALVLPKYKDEPQLIGIPMACTMGWVQSPPTFCTMSETVCDLANQRFRDSPVHAPPHRLETGSAIHDDLSRSLVPRPRSPDDACADRALGGHTDVTRDQEELAPVSNKCYKRPVGHTDVFVDDFIQLGQGGPRRMGALRRHLLHSIDSVLAKPDVSDDMRNEAVSLKKMKKGDGSWSTRKELLGWIVDTVRQTLELPPHRKLTLAKIFAELAPLRRISAKKWHRILGKLRFISVAIPGSSGLFSALQLALSRSSDGRIRITRALRHHIDTFKELAADLSSRPTHLAEIVPEEPTLLGTTDAAKAGMGGTYFDSHGDAFLWRFPFPQDIQDSLVSSDNPSGVITNSDLEHAGLLAQTAVMVENHDLRYATIANGGDNTPSLSRMLKGSVSSETVPAYLCDYSCLLQRQHRYCQVNFYLPGPANVMADDASRLQHLTDDSLLAHFNQHYPQPRPWKLVTLPPDSASSLLSALRSRSPLLPTPRRHHAPRPAPSGTGSTSAPSTVLTHPSVMSPTGPTSSASSSSMATSTDARVVPVSLSGLTPWLRLSPTWLRGSPTWVNQIPESRLSQPSSIPYSTLFTSPFETKTTHRPEPTLPTSSSSRLSSPASTPCTPSGEPPTFTSSTSSSSPTSGCCGPASIAKEATLAAAPLPSASKASVSTMAEKSYTLLRHL